MSREQETVKRLFDALVNAPLHTFPPPRGKLEAPTKPGVYIIYGPRANILHVGRTPRGSRGLRQRLANHLHGQSSFSNKFLSGDCSKLRKCGYRCIIVENPRYRALLEAYATGSLCPAHLGLSETATQREQDAVSN